MKKLLAMVLAFLLLLSLTACGDNGDEKNIAEENVAESSKTISFNELKNAFVKEGYTVTKKTGITASDFDIKSARVFDMMDFAKEVGALQKGGFAFLAQFENESAAVAAFEKLCNMMRKDGITMQTVSSSNGKKATYSNGDRFAGGKYILSQVGNTVLYAAESWDIDGEASYDDCMAMIIQGLGY